MILICLFLNFQVSNFLVTINSSVNILIYCTFGKKFRTVFMQIFFGKQPPCILTSSRSVHHNHVLGTTTNNHLTTNSTLAPETVPMNSYSRQGSPRQFSLRIERDSHIFQNCNEPSDTDAILYANDQKSVGVQAKIL